MRPLKQLVTLILSLYLSACATLELKEPPLNENLSWNQRLQQVSQIRSWTTHGLVALRTSKQSGSSNVNWQQNSSHDYKIRLFGSFGANNATITGNKHYVELTTAKGERRRANKPEKLIYDYLGWYIPVSNLNYWIRGIPVPGIAHTQTYDEYNHIINLKQAGWSIDYQRYTNALGVDLPKKINLNSANINIRIIIHSWNFNNLIITHAKSGKPMAS